MGIKLIFVKEFNKKILVTGGADFIGSHLSKWLFGMRHGVVNLDNYFADSEKNNWI